MYVNFVILASDCYPFHACMLETVCKCFTVNSEFLLGFYSPKTLQMRSFVKINPSRNGKINLSFTDFHISCPIREFPTSQICLSILFAKIKFSREFLNLQYL